MFLKSVQFSFYLLCFFSALLNHSAVFTQEDNYVNYTTADGLPSNQVYKIIQDDIGYIWFLTDKGVSKYDGYEFENFSSADGLSDNVFFDAQKAEDGSIWMLGMNGTITIYEDKNFQAYRYNDTIREYGKYIPKRVLLAANSVKIFYTGVSGYLEISGEGKVKGPFPDSLKRLVAIVDSEIGFYYYPTEILKLSNSSFRFDAPALPYSVDDGIFLPATNQFVMLKGKDSILIASHNEETIWINHKNYVSLGLLDSSCFWVSSWSGGFYVYNAEGARVSQSLNDNIVTDYYEDRLGNKWYSTLHSGVMMRKLTALNKTDWNENILQLETDANKKLYFTVSASGVYEKLAGSSRLLCRHSKLHSIPMMYSKRRESLLFFHDFTICEGDTLKALKYVVNNIRSEIVEMSGGKIGVCTHSNFYISSTDNFRVVHEERTYSAIYSDAGLAIGTESGLFINKDNDDSIKMKQSPVYEGRINKVVYFNGCLLIGTHGAGVIVTSKDWLSAQNRVNGDQIASDFISNIVVKNDSVVWVCTNEGLTQLTFNKALDVVKSVTINENQGLSSLVVNDVAFLQDTLWIATTGGLYSIEANYFDKNAQVIDYMLHFNEIFVNDNLTKVQDLIGLGHQLNRIIFNFSAIYFAETDLNYRYMLKGVDEKWNYSKERKAIYSSLEPGNYEFIVQVKGENHSWLTNAVSLKVRISPPFWKTWWFILGAIILGVLSVYAFFKYRILLYNKDLVRELFRQILKRLSKKSKSFVVREGNKNVKIFSKEINFVKSDGNYLDIYHGKGKTTIRHKIGEFMDLVPDPIEFLQLRRSYIVRIDKIEQLGKDYVVVNGVKIRVGSTYLKELHNIKLY